MSYNDSPLKFQDIKSKGIDNKISNDDSLGNETYSKALFEFIKETDTPMTIGIQGDWGMGKTSMMEMILARLKQESKKREPNNQLKTIWFNTWQYSMFHLDEYLGITAIGELLDLIKKEFDFDDNEKWAGVKKLASSLSFSFMGLTIDGNKLSDPSNSHLTEISKIIKDFKKDFNELIIDICDKYNVEKLIFFIDDLDRVKPVKALELLETMKNFFDVEKCVFVLAVDYDVVQTGMKAKFGIDFEKQSGKSFFDKIIQLPFVMPSNSYKIDEYLKDLLIGKEGEKDNGIREFNNKAVIENIGMFTKIVLCSVGPNPRSIKRVINYLRLIVKLNRNNDDSGSIILGQGKDDKKDPLIAFSIVCMQVAWPEIFSYFIERPTPLRLKQIEDWEVLDSIPSIKNLYDRSSNIDEVKTNISSFFDLFFDIIDHDDSGEIDYKEFKPVLKVLEKCKFLGTHDYQEPIDKFLDVVRKRKKQEKTDWIQEKFKKSDWFLSNDSDFKMGGNEKYGTLIYKRKQIGSLVSLSKEPLLFRIQLNKNVLTSEDEKEIDFEKFCDENHIKPIENNSITGFGNYKIEIDKISDLKKFNDIFDKLTKYFFK